MSTKIYDAYRMEKSKVDDIIDLVNKWSKNATDFLTGYEDVHKQIHVGCFYWVTLNNRGGVLEKKIEQFNRDCSWFIYPYLKESENSETRDLVYTSIRLRVTIFQDDDYWYFKFFPDNRWCYKFLSVLENNTDLEDFHYQNQTDPPEGMGYDEDGYEEYQARDDKWEELCRGTNDYSTGLIFDVMNAHKFRKLLTRYHFTGEKDLYKHLPYDYSKELSEKKENESE